MSFRSRERPAAPSSDRSAAILAVRLAGVSPARLRMKGQAAKLQQSSKLITAALLLFS